jgi:transcription elongation factor GreA
MTSSPERAGLATVLAMAADHILQSPAPHVDESGTEVVLSRREYTELVQELESVRSTHRTDLAGQLRDVRAYGVTSDNDELLAVMEESAVDKARIARLEALVRCAVVIDDDAVPADGRADLGSTVRVEDEAGKTTDYRLVGRRSSNRVAREVSLASPVGKALRGARVGDVVDVSLPSGRSRRLRVIAVTGAAVARPEAA